MARWLRWAALRDTAWRLISSRRTTAVTSGVLALVVGWHASGLFWRLVPQAPAAQPVAATARTDARSVGETSGGGDPSARLASLALFGSTEGSRAQDKQASNEQTPADAPETQLNLSLKGIYAAGGGDGLAIITTGGGQQAVYAVGDQIAGNARIKGVFRDRVVLQRNGRTETLRMPGAEAPDDRQKESTERAGELSRKERKIAERASDLRQKLLENPGELPRLVGFQPHVEGGELIGYKIRPRQADPSLLKELGLRRSDILTRVNGQKLNDPRQASKVLESLRDAEQIQVTLLRDGRERTLSIPIGKAN